MNLLFISNFKLKILNILKYFIISSVIIISIDLIVYTNIDYLRPSNYDQFVKAKQEIDYNEKWDIIAFGDSHTSDSIDPRAFARVKIKLFNLGIYHQSSIETYYTIVDTLRRLKYKPKLIIIGTNPDMILKNLNYGKYTHKLISLRSFISLWANSDGKKRLVNLLPAYRERYLIRPWLKNIMGLRSNQKASVRTLSQSSINGFLINNNCPMINFNKKCSIKKRKLNHNSEKQLAYFEKSIKKALNLGINVAVVHPPVSPYYKRCDQEYMSIFEQKINQITSKHSIKVINEIHQIKGQNFNLKEEHFLNDSHLCPPGANIFSTALIKNKLL